MSDLPKSDRGTGSFVSGLRDAIRKLTPQEQLSAALLVVLLAALLVLDYGQTTLAYLEQSSQRALAAFAVARGLNAVISVIQSAEVGLTFGVSASLSPGEVLDPFNDLIERFSLVMLVASVALWLLRLCGGLLFEASLLWGVCLLFISGLLLRRSASPWGSRLGSLLHWGSRLFMAALLFALATPLLVESVHHAGFVAQHYQESAEGLRATEQRLELMSRQIEGSGEPEAACDDWGECLGRRFSEFAGTLGGVSRVGAGIERFAEEAGEMAGEATRQVVIQIAVFLLETVLIPLLVLLLAWRLLLRSG